VTDRELVDKKLARIETCVQELRTQERLGDLLAFVAAVRARLG
jgi:hypothetical protein